MKHHHVIHVKKVQERCRVCDRLLALWRLHVGIRNQGGHTNAQSLQQIYTQYLALILTMMLSTFTHSNSAIDAKKLWIEAF